MTEEKFIRVVERTANAAIETGRHTETVIHDMIKVLYGRKDIKKLLPDGWIIANDCSECAYKDDPGDSDACYRCYNKIFNKNIIRLDPGPYTNNFKSNEEEEPKSTGKDEKDHEEKKHVEVEEGKYCYACKYEELKTLEPPCCNCYWNSARPNFTPKEEE